MKTYLRILAHARPLRRLAPAYVLFIILAILFNIANFSFLVPILNVLFDSADPTIAPRELGEFPEFRMSEAYIEELKVYFKGYLMSGNNKIVLLKRICVTLVISVFLANFFTYMAGLATSRIRTRIITNIRKKLYDKVLSLDMAFFSKEKRGDIMSRVTLDIQEVESTGVQAFSVLLKEPLTIIIIFIFLLMISVKLTIFTVVILPFSGIAIGVITRQLRRKAKQGQESLSSLLGMIDETLGGMRIIKAFNASGFIKNRFASLNNRYGKILYSMEYKKALASPVSQFLGVSVVAVILYKGGTLVFEEDESLALAPGMFFYYIVLYAQLISPIKSLSKSVSNIQRGLMAGNRIFEIIDQPVHITNKPDAMPLETLKDRITFDHIYFTYGTEDVLKDVHLEIEKGKTVALVGPSGGGKSTMMDLLPRFHDPRKGAIRIDGKDIRDYELDSIRAQLGIVTQESILFNDSIFNNIAFGIAATKEEVIEAARIANAHEFIEGLEDGYDTLIGDRGSRLSGGQRQRVTIARAILKNPPILLLDEATSALDSESEHLVQEALNNLMKNRTSLVIAHRFSTIQHADEIVVLKEGEIVERGTHQELMALNGLYKKLNLMQTV